MTGSTPPLTRSDAWIVAALCEGRRNDPIRIRDLLYSADWLNRAILTFDELSFGLPRLRSAGLVEITEGADGPLVRATDEGRALRRSVHAGTLGDLSARWPMRSERHPIPRPSRRTGR